MKYRFTTLPTFIATKGEIVLQEYSKQALFYCMKDKIIARYKAKFPDVNLSQKRLDEIADRLAPKITDESEIDAKLDEMNEWNPFTDIQKTDDKIRDLSGKLRDTKKGKDDQSSAQQSTQQQDGQQQGDDTATLLKTVLSELQSLKADKLQTSIDSAIANHEKIKDKIDPSFYEDYVKPATLEEVNAFADKVAGKHATLIQSVADQGLSTAVKPPVVKTGEGKEKITPMMQSYLERNKPVEQKTS